MPHKGQFTQGFALLTNGQTTIEDIRQALSDADFEIAREGPTSGNWQFGGDALLIPFRPEVNGYLLVDVVDQPWPDSMGGKDTESDAMTLGAWSMGFFGPFAYPGGLERARQHSWAWAEGRQAGLNHHGFIRLKMSYILGAGDKDVKVLPKEYDPLEELMFLSQVTLALFETPGVLCYFNPSGEVLRDAAGFRAAWEACRAQKKVPLPLWVNVRFFNLTESLFLMDTVGNGQLDLQDMEALFPKSSHDPGDVDFYLRNITHYLQKLRRGLKSGECWRTPLTRKLRPRTSRRLNRIAPTIDAATTAYRPAFSAATPMMSSGKLPNIAFSRPPTVSPV